MTKSKIIERLWVGSWRDAEQCLQDPNFIVVTVAWDATVVGPHFFPITDPGKDTDDWDQFAQAVQKVKELMKDSDKQILVHCQAGVNRSPSVVIAYLMDTYGFPMFRAHNIVKAARKHINPIDQQLRHAANVYNLARLFPLLSDRDPIDRSDFDLATTSEEEQMVHRIYGEILGRHADPDGLKHYGERLATGQLTPDGLRTVLLNSSEYKSKKK